MVADEGTELPFDLATERTLFFERDMEGVEDLKPKLDNAVEKALKEKDPDNPISRVVQAEIIKQAPETTTAQTAIMESLESMRAQMARMALERPQSSSSASSTSQENSRQPQLIELSGTKEQHADFTRNLIQSVGEKFSTGPSFTEDGVTYVFFDEPDELAHVKMLALQFGLKQPLV